MSSVNYSLNHKGVRLVSADKAWVKGKQDQPPRGIDHRSEGAEPQEFFEDCHFSNLLLTFAAFYDKLRIPRERRRICFLLPLGFYC